MPIYAWIIIGVVVLIVIWFIATYNSLVKRRALVDEAFSGMDVYMKKRHDLIPNLIETVKGYMAHEAQTLEAVVNARNLAANAGSGGGGSGSTGAAGTGAGAGAGAGSIDARIASESGLSSALSRMMVVVEQYPQLKADGQFINLSQQLSSIETDISQARKYYNGAVRLYNTKIALFPASIVAAMGRFEKQRYFELDSAIERNTPQVGFTR